MNYLLRGGRIIDPATGRDEVGDLYLADGLFQDAPDRVPAGVEELDAGGCVVAPGFLDLHVHLREPGREEAETIRSGCAAAAHGGFTGVVAMPNTEPAADTPERIGWLRRRAAATGCIRVYPAGCLTLGRRGEEVADLAGMAAAGAVAFTDDGGTPASEGVMRRAMIAARAAGRPVIDHAQDPSLEGGVMHEGAASRRFGLPGIPVEAEVRAVERDIRLAEETGARVHIQHLSSAAGAALIAEARRRGLPVTAELTPHHLALCDEDMDPADPDFKMNPPLRAAADRDALRRAVGDGVISVLATDHAPHTAASKERGFRDAPFGVVGLETAVGVTYTVLVRRGGMDLSAWVRRWTTGPAEVLGREAPSLAAGRPADCVVLDLQTPWRVDPAAFASASTNTPFKGWELTGRAVWTFRGGRPVYAAGEQGESPR